MCTWSHSFLRPHPFLLVYFTLWTSHILGVHSSSCSGRYYRHDLAVLVGTRHDVAVLVGTRHDVACVWYIWTFTWSLLWQCLYVYVCICVRVHVCVGVKCSLIFILSFSTKGQTLEITLTSEGVCKDAAILEMACSVCGGQERWCGWGKVLFWEQQE